MRVCRLLAWCAADVLALLTLRPDFAGLARHARAPRQWLAHSGADAAMIELADVVLWLAAAWFAIGLLAAFATHVPGSPGAAAEWLARLTLPRGLYRALAAGAGLSVVLAPVVASAATPPTPVVAAASAPVPTPSLPVTPAPPPTSTPSDVPPPTAPTGSPPHGTVVVRPGDSLWAIAAAHLGPHPTDAQVASAWPAWYAANRTIIGADPDLIVPGQVLRAPTTATD